MPTYQDEGMTHMVAIGNDDSGAPLTTDKAMAFQIWTDMIAAGFSPLWFDGSTLINSKKVILVPNTTIDPLWNSDRWHVYFEVRGNSRAPNPTAPVGGPFVYPTDRGLYMRIGSPAQLPESGAINTTLKEYPIVPDQFYALYGDQASHISLDDQNPRISIRTPMAYRLTVVPRGFVLATWTQALTEDTTKMGIVCVQRGVGCDGTVSGTGQKPLYMVTNVSATGSAITTGRDSNDGPRNLWFYSIIREADTTQSMPNWGTSGASAGDINGYRINTNCISDPLERKGVALNHFPTKWPTPVTTDTGEYILQFPFGLCTNRFAFSDEIDLLAISKADAYQHGQEVPITVYGDERTYTALNSNNEHHAINFANGIRVFVMTAGAGI